MTTPYVIDISSNCVFVSYSCDRCNIQPFFITCSQFAWGSGVVCTPDGYPTQSGKPFTPCDQCTTWRDEHCVGSCTNQARHGFTIRVDYSSNTFFAINCTGCFPSCGFMMYYNHPNAGNTASEIYGCCACGASVYPPKGVSGNFCNIGTTLHINSGTGPWSWTGPCCPNCLVRCSEGAIPGCPMQAFCESFMMVQPSSDGSSFDIRGWPCAIVYAGSCCWNWGSTPCTACAGSPAETYALICQAVTVGRCGFTGPGYGWTQMCPHCMFNTIRAFGDCCVTAHTQPRFVCTANGMPSIVTGAILNGTGFFANGQTYSTCVFKLRFVDMF